MRGLCERDDGHVCLSRAARLLCSGPAPQCIRVHAYATRLHAAARAGHVHLDTYILYINKHRVQVLHSLYDGEAIDETM
jgi:hypothetical protein